MYDGFLLPHSFPTCVYDIMCRHRNKMPRVVKIKILTDFQFLGEECSDGNPNILIISNI